ncbi:hypothetical protein HPB47_013306 [Ixodes persulcatus]|uniref:Uncharacterized protein n=1 Tax=Ixodes persulcatus TaxID=34615 RepID=A0AC60QZ43_IXOPE|nr:hypothetical protein HPB47_013306 [Ixodes persulcatus]
MNNSYHFVRLLTNRNDICVHKFLDHQRKVKTGLLAAHGYHVPGGAVRASLAGILMGALSNSLGPWVKKHPGVLRNLFICMDVASCPYDNEAELAPCNLELPLNLYQWCTRRRCEILSTVTVSSMMTSRRRLLRSLDASEVERTKRRKEQVRTAAVIHRPRTHFAIIPVRRHNMWWDADPACQALQQLLKSNKVLTSTVARLSEDLKQLRLYTRRPTTRQVSNSPPRRRRSRGTPRREQGYALTEPNRMTQAGQQNYGSEIGSPGSRTGRLQNPYK